MENQHNNAKMFRLTGLQFSKTANDDVSSLTAKETAKKLHKIAEEIVTINEERCQEFINISDDKMRNNLNTLFGAILRFEKQCLSQYKRLHKLNQ